MRSPAAEMSGEFGHDFWPVLKVSQRGNTKNPPNFHQNGVNDVSLVDVE